MPLFSYKARDEKNRIFKGLVEAASETEAQSILEGEDFSILYLRVTKDKRKFFLFPKLTSRLSSKDMVILSRQLATLVSSNLPLVEALDTLVKQSEQQQIKIIVSQVADAVRGGKKLSEALAEHPNVFNNFYIKLIQTGEKVGKLDEVLEYLANEQEKSYNLRAKIKGMMIYPSFVFLLLIAISVFLMIFVVPKILIILQESNAPLPLATRILISFSGFLKTYGWLVFLVIIFSSIIFYLYIRSRVGRGHWDVFKLRIPVLGKILQNISIVQLANSLALLLKGGVDTVTALKTVANSLENTVYQDLMKEAAQAVEDGNYLANSLANNPVIPYMVVAMVRVGERAGHLDNALEKINDFYSYQVERSVSNLVNVIEPVVIVLMGLGVGVVVAAMILPMYQVVGGV